MIRRLLKFLVILVTCTPLFQPILAGAEANISCVDKKAEVKSQRDRLGRACLNIRETLGKFKTNFQPEVVSSITKLKSYEKEICAKVKAADHLISELKCEGTSKENSIRVCRTTGTSRLAGSSYKYCQRYVWDEERSRCFDTTEYYAATSKEFDTLKNGLKLVTGEILFSGQVKNFYQVNFGHINTRLSKEQCRS